MSRESLSAALAVGIVIFFTEQTKHSLGDNVFCGKPREFRLLAEDTALSGHVIASYEVATQGECLFHCHENKECHSYNYRFTLHNTGNLGLCEINKETLKSCPLKKTRKEGYGYFKKINAENQTQPYGSETNPGMSCLDINGCHNNDGEYWVSSEETSWSALKAFCYMNTLGDANIINLAKNKPAVQSSTVGGTARKAVDGKRYSQYIRNSCTHTIVSTTSPWWRVDLQSVFFIRKLIITNRSDLCCFWRLSNFKIKIGLSLDDNGNSNPSCGGYHSLKEEITKTIVCPKLMIGRYVNIIIPGTGKILTLCEVEVYP